jgi:hypothetical protein
MPTYHPDDQFDGPLAEPEDAALVGAALRRTAEALPPADGRALMAAGYARGRVLRRRRTAAIATGVAVFALVGAGGVLAAGAGHGHGGGGNVAAAPKQPRPTGSTVETARTLPPVTAQQMSALLVSMLPKGRISGVEARGTDDDPPVPYAHVVYDDGHGKAAIEVGVSPPSDTNGGCSAAPDPGTSCTSTHVKGGTLSIFKGYEYSDRRADTKDWLATFVTPDGASVEVSEWNAAAEKDAPVSRPEPPLSGTRLGAVASDPRWKRVIDAMPEPAKAPESGGGRTTFEEQDALDGPAQQ